MTAFAVLVPLLNGCVVALVSYFITESVSNRLIFAILGASAFCIAVPAVMRRAALKADPGLYLPMALGVTFTFLGGVAGQRIGMLPTKMVGLVAVRHFMGQ